MSKHTNKTTRRTFLAKTGAITTGLTLGTTHINAIRYFGTNPDSLPEMHKNANIYGSADKAGYFDQIVEVPHDHYIIFPEPKMINKSEGKVSLSSFRIDDMAEAPHTTALLQEKLRDQYNFSFAEQKNSNKLIISTINHKRIQKILKQHNLENILRDKKSDSYIIIVTKKEILLAGQDDRGIYYAVRSLLQMISHSTLSGEKPQVDCMHIVDWPDQEFRAVFWRMDTMGDTKPDLNMIKHYIYTAIAGSRYKALVFMMRCGLKYKSHPEIALEGAYTREDFKEIVAFAKMHYLEPVPAMNTPGHADWILNAHPELAELNNRTICTRNPDALKLVFAIAYEMIELCGGVGNVRYFHIGHDEVRWRMAEGPKYKILRDECPLCKDTEYKQIFLEYIKKEHDFFTKRGIRMIMWDDMLSEYHNGEKYNTSDIVGDLPKDIILSPWSSIAYPSIPEWLKLGFTVIKGATGFKIVSVNDKDVLGHMLAYFTREMWLTYHYVAPTSHNYYNHLSTYIYGNNAWNNDLSLIPKDESEYRNLKTTVQVRGELKKHIFLMKYGNAMNYCYINKRFPSESHNFVVVDLNNYFNKNNKNCFSAGEMFDLSGFKPGNYAIAGIPMKLGKSVVILQFDNKNHVEEGIKIILSSKASSLIFLHTAFLAETDMPAFNNRIQKDKEFLTQTKKSPVAFYLVRYSDNTTEKAIMHFGYNVGNLRPPIHSRYPYDVRHVYREKQNQNEWPEAKDGRDITPGAPALYQYEWINPHPGKSISEINFISMGTEVIPALAALTTRDVK